MPKSSSTERSEPSPVIRTILNPTRFPRPRPRVRSEPVFQLPFERGSADLHALAVTSGGTSYVSAGVPWFLCLFGRDTLVSALMSGVLGDWPARGALAALESLQSTVRDDWRDAEPGKLPHELRRGELAFRKEIPHAPYYGTHDAPALYCLTLWNAWRWTGDESLLDAHLETAERALSWCDQLGDRDGDGLQEYATRSRLGYYNQSWKDAADAILDPTGGLANCRSPPSSCRDISMQLDWRWRSCTSTSVTMPKPSACEIWRRSCAVLSRTVIGSTTKASMRSPSTATRNRYEQSLPTRGTCCGAVCRARTMLAGLHCDWWPTTCSADGACAHFRRSIVRYNPMSYQCGSVWPHDTMLAAAGMFRYGLNDEAAGLIRGLLDAACALEDARLPELFCGIERQLGGPVPYAEANIPQAWAAAAAPLAAQLFLGIVRTRPAPAATSDRGCLIGFLGSRSIASASAGARCESCWLTTGMAQSSRTSARMGLTWWSPGRRLPCGAASPRSRIAESPPQRKLAE